MMKVTTYGKNILVNGAKYTITYSACTPNNIGLSVNPENSGTVKASKESACEGETITLTPTPADGYYFGSWEAIDGEYNEFTINSDNTFTMPAAEVVITGYFTKCDKLDAPVATLSDVTAVGATVSWSAVANASSYSVYVLDNAGETALEQENVTSPYTITGLSHGSTYHVSVRAVGDNHRYCDMECDAIEFTTADLDTHTITWMVSGTATTDGNPTTSVVSGGTITTLPTDPATPSGCPDKVFIGWSATNISGSADDVPADLFTTAPTETIGSDKIYYAVFATKTTSGGEEIVLWAEEFTHFNTNTPSAAGTGSGTTIYGGATIAYTQSSSGAKAFNEQLAGGTSPELLLYKSGTWTISGIPTNGATQMTLTFLANKTTFELTSSTTGITISGSGTSWTITNTTNTTFDLTLKNPDTKNNARIDNVSLVGVCSTTTYSECQTLCEACDAPATALSLTSGADALNLDANGTASTTLTPVGGNGGTVAYTVTPSDGVTISGNTVTFTAVGTYTIVAKQAKTGSYCPQNASATITVKATPVVNITAVAPATLEALCGAQATGSITVSGYNLGTTPITLASNITLVAVEPASITPTDGKVSGQTVTLTYTSTAGQSTESGTATITATSGTGTATVDAAYKTTACEKVKVTFLDHDGTTVSTVEDFAQNTIDESPTPSSTCTGYTFDGWAAATVANGSTTYDEVTFPYTITGATTLYAVYRTSGGVSSDFWSADIDNGELAHGDDYILAAYSSSTEYALTCNAASTSGKLATTKVTTTKINDSYYEINDVTDNTLVWKLVGDDTNGYAFLNHSTGTYLTVSNGSLVMAKEPSTKYKITHPDPTDYPVTVQRTDNSNYLSASGSTVVFGDNSTSSLTLFLYVRKPNYTYTSAPACCSAAAAVTVAPAATSINLGTDGTASTTISSTPSGVTYSLWPTSGATITDGTFTATAAGVYTITGTYTDGSCSSTGSAFVAVTKLPMFEAATIDKAEFAVTCGDTTSMSSAATITLGANCNLTKTITVTVPEGFLISTAKSTASKYAQSLTLTPTASGAKAGQITGNVYVRAYAAVARTDGYSGNITFKGDEIETQTIAVSSAVTCANYDIVFNDRGTNYATRSGMATTTVDAPDDPTGVCTTPTYYIFDGWAEATVAEGSTTYTKVSFPYTIPKKGATLYAVYRYSDDGSTEPTKISGISDITDGGKYFITATYNSTEYVLKAAKFSVGNGAAVEFDKTTIDESAAWTFTKYGTTDNQWYIKSGTNYLYCSNKNDGLACGTTSDYFTASASTGTTIKLQDNSYSRYVALYNSTSTNNWRCYTVTTSGISDLQLYKSVSYYYTTSPLCGPYLQITGGRALYVTSGNAGGTRSSVQAQDTIRFVAGALKGSGTNAPSVKVNAQADHQYNVADRTLNTTISTTIDQKVTQDGDEYTIEGTIVVTYKPTTANTLETVRIVPHITYNTTATLDSATVYARSLPEKFVIAAQNGDKWYALPANMASSSTYAGNGQLTVDDTTNPTAATAAPCNTIYTFDGMKQSGDYRYARFVGLEGKYLWASAAGNTGIQNNGTDPAATQAAYNWLLNSSDLVTYTIGNGQNERLLSLSTASGTENNFGMYAQSNITAVRLLPVADTCAYDAAPQGLRVVTKKSTEVTLAWAAVATAEGYQYSTDGTTYTDIADCDLEEPSATITGLEAQTDYTIYIRARHGQGTNICSDVASVAVTTAACDDVPAFGTISGTLSQNCGTISLAGFSTTVTTGTLCPVEEWGIEYSTDKTFHDPKTLKHVKLDLALLTSGGDAADFVAIDEPGDYYFRAFATNEVGSGYSALFADGTAMEISGVAGLKIMFENNDNTAPMVAGTAKKRIAYYSESPAKVTWAVSPATGSVSTDGYFTGTAMGVYTITATQAATDDYCAATATAYIEVRTPRYHSFVTNCAKLNNGNIEVVNQHRDYMDVMVDSADIVKLTIVRDNTGSNTGQITGGQAKDLFFSKYYEAKAALKLLAIYNGTSEDISLADTKITFTKSTKSTPDETLDLSSLGSIPAGKEYIFYSFTDNTSGSTNEGPSVVCVSDEIKFNHENWFPTKQSVADMVNQMENCSITCPFSTGTLLNMSGDRAMALIRGTEVIDVFGAYDNGYVSDSKIKEITTPVTVHRAYDDDKKPIISRDTTMKMNDAKGWYCESGTDYATGEVIALSTNRFLLIRKNTVVDGSNAVMQNKADFVTLCEEWEGEAIGKFTDADSDNKTTCLNFVFVADFDYAKYFNRYEAISDSIKITADGVRQPDGTYRISASDIKLDGFTDFTDLSCSNIKIQGFNNGSEAPSTTLDYRVPIIIDASTTTADEASFGFDGFGSVVCPECDVVIRDNAKLEVVKGGYNQLRDVYVYPTGRLQIGDQYTYSTRHVYVSSDNNDVGYALVEGTLSALLGVGHYKRIDALAWYDFALPYDCKVADIARSNGKSLGTYGTDWFIKYYDGQKRAISGTPNGAAPTNWEHVPADGTLKAGVGYIIGMGGLHEVEPNLPQYKVRISLPNVSGQVYTESNTDDRKLSVTGYTGPKAEELPCHRGWNYIGNPFISRFDGQSQTPEWSTDLLLDGYYTDKKTGTTYDVENYPDIYVAVDEATDGSTNWVQTTASAANLLPFRAFFVQAVGDGHVDFAKAARNLPAGAPARHSDQRDAVSMFDLVLTNANQQAGSARVKIGDGFSRTYEVGHDMVRMINKKQPYPQPYTIDSVGYSMICQAIDRETPVNQTIPVGFYTRTKGTYTFSIKPLQGMNRYDAVYLEDNLLHTVTDLLQGDYTFATAAGTTDGRFSIYLRNSKVPTEITNHEGVEPVVYRHGDALIIESLPAGAQVRIVDAVGRVLYQQHTDGSTVTFHAPVRGAYLIQVTSGNDSYSIKTIL